MVGPLGQSRRVAGRWWESELGRPESGSGQASVGLVDRRWVGVTGKPEPSPRG